MGFGREGAIIKRFFLGDSHQWPLREGIPVWGRLTVHRRLSLGDDFCWSDGDRHHMARGEVALNAERRLVLTRRMQMYTIHCLPTGVEEVSSDPLRIVPPMPHEAISAHFARRLRLVLPVLAAGLALVTVGATFLGSTGFAALGKGLVPMSPIAVALVVVLAGAMLWMERAGDAIASRRLTCAVVLPVAALTAAFMVQHGVDGTLSLEQWLGRLRPGLQLTSFLTDLSLLGVALSFLFRWWPASSSWASRQTASALALLPLVLSSVVLLSYAAGVPLLYGTGHIPMSMPAALCVWALGLAGLLAAGFETWPLATFRLKSGETLSWPMFGTSIGTLTLFLSLGVLILVGGSFLMRHQLQEARGSAQAELAAIADAKSRLIADWMEERRADADLLARNTILQTQMQKFLVGSSQAPSERDMQTSLDSFLHTTYFRALLFDGQGRLRLSASKGQEIGSFRPDSPEVQQALAAPGVLILDLHRDASQANLHMSVWIPIQRESVGGRAQGTLALMLDPHTFLFPLVQSWPTVSPSAETLLVRRDGEDVLFLNDLRHRDHTAMNLHFDLAGHPDLPAAQVVQGREGFLDGTDYRGISVLSVSKRVPGTPWCMVAKMDAAEVFGPLRQRMWIGGLALLGLVGTVGVGLGALLRRRDAAAARQKLGLAQRFEWIMREANDIILLLDGEGRILEANTRAAESYGYALAELQGKNVMHLRVPESLVEAQGQFEQTLQAGTRRFEALHQRQDGSVFPVEVSSRAITIEGEQRVISFIRDITERRAQAEALQRMTQLYSALSQVNQAIVWSTSREALLDKICEVMVEFGRFSMAWIGLADPHTQQVKVVARHGDARGYLDRIRVESGPSPLGSGPVGIAIREGCACVENDFLDNEGTAPWHEAAAASGFQSMATFPIREGGKVVGALAVYAQEKEFFGHQEAALLEEAAMDISFALDHLGLENQRHATEVALLESDRLLREAQEAGRIGSYTWYIRDDAWSSSPFLDQIFGIGPEHPRNLEGWTRIVAPEFREDMRAYVRGIIERHERFDLDYPIVRASDGATRWVHGQGEIHHDAEGLPVALVGIIQDITERKLAEQALRKVTAALEQSPFSIIITKPNGIIEYVNPYFTRMTGFSAEEAIGQNPRILKGPNTPPELYATLWSTLLRGETWAGEFENRKKNGEPFYERASIAPVRDEVGVLTGFIAIKEDISQEKKNEVERRSLEAQLHQSQKLESLGSLAGGVAHDMNNVMGAILGIASVLRESAQPASVEARNLDTIISACMRGRGVVKSLLYFAKKDLQEERPFDVNDLVKEMSQLLGHITLKRVLLTMDLQEGIGLLRGDPGALSHALMNLCVNATDAMSQGGTLRIKTALDEGGDLLLTVRDSGEGMSPEVLAKALEPFFTTKPAGKGTGLGLAMVYGTMKAHDGSMELLSEVGKGTEISLRFPVSRMQAPEAETAPPTGPAATGHTNPLRILLVDDDELIRESVAPMLEMLGHVVATAPGGAPALRLLEAGEPVDLLILDMNMPGMNGGEALPLILALRPGLPVILATGYSDHEVAPLLEGRPSVMSLRKPFSLAEIRQLISTLRLRDSIDQES